jgi:hypothetical protein
VARLSRSLIALTLAIAAMSLPAAGAGGDGPVAGASGKRVLLISNCNKAKFEPTQVIIDCGDAGLIAKGLTWSTWTRKTADGTGTGVIEICKPDCASGKTKSAPIALHLSKPQKCSNGKRLFSKLRYTWTQNAPTGPQSDTQPMGCKLASL